MKKVLGLTLACVIGVSSITGTVFAQDVTPEATYLIEQGYLKGTESGLELDRNATGAEALTMLYRVAGMDKSLTAETSILYGTLSVKENEVMLTTDNSEYILHTENAMAIIGDENKSFDDAKDELNGKEIGVVVGPTMTLSLPAQTNALYFLQNTENANPIYIEISEVKEEDDAIMAYSADGNYVARMDKEMILNPLKTRNIIKATDLKEGDKIVVYADILTRSIPAQANATNVTVLQQSIKPDHWAGDIIEDAENKEFIETKLAETQTIFGTLTIGEEGTIITDYEAVQYALRTENTMVFAGSEFAELSSLNGKEVCAVVSPYMTRSIPAQTEAFYITTATEEENPIYIEISEIYEKENGRIMVYGADGRYVANMDKTMDLTPARTKNIIKAGDLKVGDRILAYSQIMTMSIPAHLNPEKVLVLQQSDVFQADAEITADALAEISVKMFAEKAQEALSMLKGNSVTRDSLVKFCYNLLK